MFKKAVAVAVIAAAAIFTAPVAANAAGYVPAGKIVVSDTTPAPGDPVVITFTDGSFVAGDSVNASVEGDPTPAIAIIKSGIASTTKTVSATGSVSFTVTASTPGSYTVTAVGTPSGNVGIASFTVVTADSGLPNTGAQFPVLPIWAGAGALALGVALVLVMTISRRRIRGA